MYYVDAGTITADRPLSGVLEFIDPRAGVEAVTAPGDPYGEPMRVRPQAGLIVIFPSWLYHWVHPYAGHTPRIAVSFNVTRSAGLKAERCADMSIPAAYIKLSIVLALTSVTLFTTSASGQSPPTTPDEVSAEKPERDELRTKSRL